MVRSTPRPHFIPGKDPVPILQEINDERNIGTKLKKKGEETGTKDRKESENM